MVALFQKRHDPVTYAGGKTPKRSASIRLLSLPPLPHIFNSMSLGTTKVYTTFMTATTATLFLSPLPPLLLLRARSARAKSSTTNTSFPTEGPSARGDVQHPRNAFTNAVNIFSESAVLSFPLLIMLPPPPPLAVIVATSPSMILRAGPVPLLPLPTSTPAASAAAQRSKSLSQTSTTKSLDATARTALRGAGRRGSLRVRTRRSCVIWARGRCAESTASNAPRRMSSSA